MSIKRKSFTLIEAVVSVAIIMMMAVAFAPNLSYQNNQSNLDRAVSQLQSAIYETRSLAVSPTTVTQSGKISQAWIIIFNISQQNHDYTPAGQIWSIPANSYAIFSAEDTNPNFPRRQIKKVSLPSDISIYYDLPCHGNEINCPANSAEAWFWKPHFRHADGVIGFNGRYYNFPDSESGHPIGYWLPEVWGNSVNPLAGTPSYSQLVVILGKINGTQNITDVNRCSNGVFDNNRSQPCKILRVDNITGEVDVL